MRSVSRQLRSLLHQRVVLAWVRGPAAGMFAIGTAMIVLARAHGAWRGLSEQDVELTGLVVAGVGWLIYIWARRSIDIQVLRQLDLTGGQLRLLAAQAPADVWTTDAELRLTSVFGTLVARLETPEARVPGRTLYEVFETRDAAHPVIAAHLRALRGETAAYERVSGDLVLSGCVKPLRDERGLVIGCIGTAMDMSSWRWAERQVRHAEAARLESEEHFRHLADSMADALLVGQDGRNVYANPAAARLIGTAGPEALVGQDMLAIVEPTSHEFARQQMQRALTGEQLPPVEDRFVRRDGSPVPVEIAVSASTWQGRPAVQIVARDITERRRAEEAREWLAALVESSEDAIVSATTEGTILTWNPAAERLFGYTALEAIGKSISIVFPPERAEEMQRNIRTFNRGQPVGPYETERVRSDGRVLSVAVSLSPIKDDSGRVVGVSGNIRDVAEHKRSEAAVLRSRTELRALARRLHAVREEEHTRMARDIHDELGQALTALRLDLSWLGKKLPEAGAAVQRRIRAMVALTEDTIEAGRRIAAELRPPILDDLGLAPSLEWYVQHFAKRAGLRYEWDPGPAEPAVDRELAVIAYRIVQEALTNVARHAQAKHLAVRLGEQDGQLTIEIRDDGQGISEDAVTSLHSLGIVGMRERAMVRGGSLTLIPLPEGGTSVRVSIPIERRQEPRAPR